MLPSENINAGNRLHVSPRSPIAGPPIRLKGTRDRRGLACGTAPRSSLRSQAPDRLAGGDAIVDGHEGQGDLESPSIANTPWGRLSGRGGARSPWRPPGVRRLGFQEINRHRPGSPWQAAMAWLAAASRPTAGDAEGSARGGHVPMLGFCSRRQRISRCVDGHGVGTSPIYSS